MGFYGVNAVYMEDFDTDHVRRVTKIFDFRQAEGKSGVKECNE